MSIINKYTIALVSIFVLIGLGFYWSNAFGGVITLDNPTTDGVYRNYEFFASSTVPAIVATSTSAVSTSIVPYIDSEGRYDDGSVSLVGAKKATFYFGRAWNGGNAGKSVFSVEVSPDGTEWFAFNKLIGDDVGQTATSTVTIANATSTVITSMDLSDDTFLKARCVVTETTDGEHRCRASIEY